MTEQNLAYFSHPLLRNIVLDRTALDSLFFDMLEKLFRFAQTDQWMQDDPRMTVCCVFRFIEKCTKSEKGIDVKYIPWATVVGQKLAKRMAGALEEYANEKKLQVGQGAGKVS